MTQIPPAFESLVLFLANEKHNPGFVGGLLVFFGVSGFLAGYLLTRLFLATAFSEADRAANSFNLKSTQLPTPAGPQPSGEMLAQIVRSPREAVFSNWELLVTAGKNAIAKREPTILLPRQSAGLLAKLVELQILNGEQAKVFDELRRLRNIAAHSSEAITEEAATDYVNNAKALTEKLSSTAASDRT